MWTIYGVDSPNVEGVTRPKFISIGDFKESESISKDDFENSSYAFLCINRGIREGGVTVWPTGNKASAYYSGYTTNVIGYNRFNILHRKTVEGGQIQYEYDGCYYTWAFHTSGTNVYYFDGYNQGVQGCSICPAVDFSPYTNNEIPRQYVTAMYLIATEGNHDSGIGVVRPLWVFNFSDLPLWGGDDVQAVLGPVIDSVLIDEWLKGNKIDNPDAPIKPMDPEDADQHAAVSAGWTWHNKFKIMNWSGPWPNKLLIEGPPADMTDFWNNYAVYNQVNDTDNYYHILSTYTGDSIARANFMNSLNNMWKNINDQQSEVGHSINNWWGESGIPDEGYFTTHNRTIDGVSASADISWSLTGPSLIDIGEMTLDWRGKDANNSYDLRGVKIKTGSKYFEIGASYPHNTLTFVTSTILGTYDFMDPCIIRHGGHYYLGGNLAYGTGYTAGAFVIICRIDNLQSMPNYGGPNPGDPDPTDPDATGADTDKLNDIFGDGTKTAPNATTENIINGNIGDFDGPLGTGTAGDGSAFNEDGTPRDPADYDGTGTGEKNTNPVDSHAVPNSHDGSMGNGTGDPHKDDEKIDDPSSTIPIYIRTEGTVSGSGVLDVFTPTLAELNTFTSELLSSTVLQSIKNYFTTNPMDGIFGLHILPYTGFAGTATANPRIGTHNFTAALTLAEKEFITVDYGSKYIDFVYDGFENFAPYSDAKIFLPFLGTKDIDINIIQGSICHLKYNVSLVTGDIYAYMYCQWAGRWGDAGTPQGVEHLVYSWQGNCAATVPLSHLDSTNYISGAMQVAGGITSLAAGAAMANPMAMVSGAAAVSNGISETGRTSIVTSGNISGMAAFMGARQPFFIISRPIVAFSEAYNHYLGQRSNAIQRIDDLRSGTYTVMRNVDLKGISATGDEITELTSILKGGFYK